MQTFKAPDLSAPRFRPKRTNILNKRFIDRFKAAHPRFSDIGSQELKEIVYALNGGVWKTVIDFRDGVELPQQMGNIFIASCQRKKRPNPNMVESARLGKLIQNRNWDSDGYIAKIFYTNFGERYRFKLHDLWSFVAVRDFKRNVAARYPKEYTKYLVVDKSYKISRFFRNRELIVN